MWLKFTMVLKGHEQSYSTNVIFSLFNHNRAWSQKPTDRVHHSQCRTTVQHIRNGDKNFQYTTIQRQNTYSVVQSLQYLHSWHGVNAMLVTLRQENSERAWRVEIQIELIELPTSRKHIWTLQYHLMFRKHRPSFCNATQNLKKNDNIILQTS